MKEPRSLYQSAPGTSGHLYPQAKLIQIRDADLTVTHPLAPMLPHPLGQVVPAFELRH
ncbi:hypothetical protein SBA3_4060001 [Candidatus Sulfopaludibacter sp. SbA3]|nr:hypothetical protein SBA3_4060001 [Candidatus Sulfopaludibacter sp. SbA3]